MRIFYSKYLPPKNFGAVNLFGIIIVRKDYGMLDESEKNHEMIHTRQMVEMLVIPFYLFYGIEWIIRFIQYRDGMKAYENISYEREAYANMYNLSYLKSRKFFSFIHYYKGIKRDE